MRTTLHTLVQLAASFTTVAAATCSDECTESHTFKCPCRSELSKPKYSFSEEFQEYEGGRNEELTTTHSWLSVDKPTQRIVYGKVSICCLGDSCAPPLPLPNIPRSRVNAALHFVCKSLLLIDIAGARRRHHPGFLAGRLPCERSPIARPPRHPCADHAGSGGGSQPCDH